MNNEYHFITRWRMEATPERIFAILRKPLEFPRWWSAVYLEVALEDKPETVRFVTKGRLPYRLRWTSETITSREPDYLAIRARGDFEGCGIWTLAQSDAHTDVTFEWKLTVEKPLLRFSSFLLKPLFEWNHRWAMEQGRSGLAMELKRLP